MIEFKNNCFYLNTKSSSYVIAVGDGGVLRHLYYGEKLIYESDLNSAYEFRVRGFDVQMENGLFLSTELLEYPTEGCGDYRSPALSIVNSLKERASFFTYKSHHILEHKPSLEGLPSARSKGAEVLAILCEDNWSKTKLVLYYCVYEDYDVITRYSKIINKAEDIVINKIMSLSFDIKGCEQDIVYLSGRYAKERNFTRQPVSIAQTIIGSNKGNSSHEFSPFFALADKNTNENFGQVCGYQLVYSGNWTAEIQASDMGDTRINMGINPETFCWNLAKGESFFTPEVVMTYSLNGFNKMSNNFSDFIRDKIIPKRFAFSPRPILTNTWDVCVFDATEEKCLQIAKKAKACGIEMLVIDDGWFGRRDWSELDGIGDWQENLSKFPHGLEYLCDNLNKMGIDFGLWIEPEMVNPKSDLFLAHPEWVLQYSSRSPHLSRREYVLDMSNSLVVDYLIDTFTKLFCRINIKYVKLDSNRNICEYNSLQCDSGEVAHRYILGLYRFLETITKRFPNILIENCCGGGGRLDLGICSFSPQTWISDNTDAFERLTIQKGASYFLPSSVMSCHVTECENGRREASLDYRFMTACYGVLGYENDLLKASDDDTQLMIKQIEFYKSRENLMLCGDFYRLFDDGVATSFCRVSKDKTIAEFCFFMQIGDNNSTSRQIKLAGLQTDKKYIFSSKFNKMKNEFAISGEQAMKIGVPILNLSHAGEFCYYYIAEKPTD